MFQTADDRQQQDGDDCGAQQRERDPEERPDLPRSVHPGRVEQLVGHGRGRIDLHQVDPERVEQRRQDHRPDRVGQVEVGEQDERRDDQRGQRHHHRAQQYREHQPTSPESELCEAVAGEHGQDGGARTAGDGVEQRVADPAEVDALVVGEQLLQVRQQCECLVEPEGAAAAVEQASRVLGAGDEQPPDRDEEVDHQYAQEQVSQDMVAAPRLRAPAVASARGLSANRRVDACCGHVKMLPRLRVKNRKT